MLETSGELFIINLTLEIGSEIVFLFVGVWSSLSELFWDIFMGTRRELNGTSSCFEPWRIFLRWNKNMLFTATCWNGNHGIVWNGKETRSGSVIQSSPPTDASWNMLQPAPDDSHIKFPSSTSIANRLDSTCAASPPVALGLALQRTSHTTEEEHSQQWRWCDCENKQYRL